MQNITDCHKFCISCEAPTKRNFKTHNLLALYIQFSNQTPIAREKNVTTPLFTLIPLVAVSYSQWLLQQNFCCHWLSPMWDHMGLSLLCYLIFLWIMSSRFCLYHILFTHSDKKMVAQNAYNRKHYFKPKAKTKWNQNSQIPNTLNSCSRNSQCPFFLQEQDSINVEYFRAI